MSQFSADFPAKQIETALSSSDLALAPAVTQQVREIENWIGQSAASLHKQGVGAPVTPGYRALFDGSSSAGKAAAALIGKQTGRDVFRVDVSLVVSKSTDETERNLSTLFDKAEKGNWILFFDEADALFGKRTDVRDTHDKYANQEVAYLLQGIESYSGVVILATNQRANVDDAFIRRCQSVVHFP